MLLGGLNDIDIAIARRVLDILVGTAKVDPMRGTPSPSRPTTIRPACPANAGLPGRLRGQLATREISDRTLDQWQYEVTAGGRIWFCPDEQRRIVWVVVASPSQPKATE